MKKSKNTSTSSGGRDKEVIAGRFGLDLKKEKTQARNREGARNLAEP
ncbi:hypothetical protein MOE18_17330 [Bacillus sonorensis]|nr:hypothetical protein [Bacillus sonorensis]MCY8606395.1 hypothetical protein [Bacillus sonorensis]